MDAARAGLRLAFSDELLWRDLLTAAHATGREHVLRAVVGEVSARVSLDEVLPRMAPQDRGAHRRAAAVLALVGGLTRRRRHDAELPFMRPVLIAALAAAGLAAGPVLRAVIAALSVPSGRPWRRSCPACERPLPPAAARPATGRITGPGRRASAAGPRPSGAASAARPRAGGRSGPRCRCCRRTAGARPVAPG